MAGKIDESESQPEISEQGKSRVLDVTLAAQGLSTLGLSAKGLEFAYLHLSLPGYALTDVSILTNYTHIQKLDLSHNNIHDNKLTELCAFSPLSFLRVRYNKYNVQQFCSEPFSLSSY
uniref:Uncharacterized protein n=1 Tax=Eptatretus burgeri TaxID=7764 RepID=A0A8C4QFE6_EPTBU